MNAARIALIVAASVTAAGARDVHSDFSVSVIVRAVANIEIQSAPSGLDISAADLRRGYVDVMQPTQFTVRSNSPNGFALEVLTVAPVLSSMIVEGLNSDLALGAEGGTIVQRWQKPQAVNLSLKFRFALAPGLTAGNYPWPVRLRCAAGSIRWSDLVRHRHGDDVAVSARRHILRRGNQAIECSRREIAAARRHDERSGAAGE